MMISARRFDHHLAANHGAVAQTAIGRRSIDYSDGQCRDTSTRLRLHPEAVPPRPSRSNPRDDSRRASDQSGDGRRSHQGGDTNLGVAMPTAMLVGAAAMSAMTPTLRSHERNGDFDRVNRSCQALAAARPSSRDDAAQPVADHDQRRDRRAPSDCSIKSTTPPTQRAAGIPHQRAVLLTELTRSPCRRPGRRDFADGHERLTSPARRTYIDGGGLPTSPMTRSPGPRAAISGRRRAQTAARHAVNPAQLAQTSSTAAAKPTTR